MSRIRAVVMEGAGRPVEVRDFAKPDLKASSALMKVELSEVCGTDVHLFHSRLEGVPYPIIPGHVSVGCLQEVRGDMRDIDGVRLEEGDRVTFLDVHKTCYACWSCLVAKASTRCPARKVYGITYGVGDGLLGGWSEALVLEPGVKVLRLGDMAFEHFMAGGCGLPTALHAVDRARIRIGDTVLVLGSGPVGLSVVAFARMQGASRVYCIGAPEERLRVAREMGADETLSLFEATEDERLEWILERTGGRGGDIVIEAAGAPEAAVQAMRFARDAGRVVIVGQYTDHGEVAFNPHVDLNKKHLEVLACWGSDFSHFYRAVQVMTDERRSLPWGALSCRRFGLGAAQEALEAVSSGTLVKALIDPAV